MAKIPEDIKKGIKQLSEANKIPVETLLQELKEIIQTDETIQTMGDDEFKIRFAWAQLYRNHSARGRMEDYFIMPISNPRTRVQEIKGEPTLIGEMIALVQKVEENEDGDTELGDVQYAFGSIWRDDAKQLDNLEPNVVYKASLRIKENSWGVKISGANNFAKSDHKMMSFKEFYDKEIKDKDITISIGEMDLNKSETDTDIKVIEVTIAESDVGERDDGSEYGRYTVFDDSISGSTFTIFLDKKDCIYAQGSVLKIGGTIRIDKKEIPRWTYHFQIPTELAMKRELIVKPVKGKQEEVDLSLDEEETKPEEPKEEKPKEEPKKEESDEDVNFEI